MNDEPYICDRKKDCNISPDCGLACKRTFDKKHAINICETCRYENNPSVYEPCRSCSINYENKWEAR